MTRFLWQQIGKGRWRAEVLIALLDAFGHWSRGVPNAQGENHPEEVGKLMAEAEEFIAGLYPTKSPKEAAHLALRVFRPYMKVEL